MKLSDWLDAGYAFLVRDCDPTARQLFDELFRAETDDDLRFGFDALRLEMDWRREESDRIEAEARKRAKGSALNRPRPVKRVAPGALEAALAEWGPPAS